MWQHALSKTQDPGSSVLEVRRMGAALSAGARLVAFVVLLVAFSVIVSRGADMVLIGRSVRQLSIVIVLCHYANNSRLAKMLLVVSVVRGARQFLFQKRFPTHSASIFRVQKYEPPMGARGPMRTKGMVWIRVFQAFWASMAAALWSYIFVSIIGCGGYVLTRAKVVSNSTKQVGYLGCQVPHEDAFTLLFFVGGSFRDFFSDSTRPARNKTPVLRRILETPRLCAGRSHVPDSLRLDGLAGSQRDMQRLLLTAVARGLSPQL